MKVSKDLKTIYLLAIASSLIFIGYIGVLTIIDSETYVEAWYNYQSGKLDFLRTPIYPCFLGILERISGKDYFLQVAICVQHVVFLVSIYYFHEIASMLISSKRINFWLTIFYALFPPITIWNNFIMTESFAISFSIFLIYSTISLYHKWTLCPAIANCFTLLFLIFLRPALIYLIPVLCFFWLILFFDKLKRFAALFSLSSILMTSLCLFSYMKAFENEYGIFSSSCVGTMNQTVIATQYDLFNPDVINNRQLKNAVKNLYKNENDIIIDDNADYYRFQSRAKEASIIWRNFDIKTINDAIVKSYLSNPIKWTKKCIARIYRSTERRIYEDSLPWLPYINLLLISLGISFGYLYFFLLFYAILMFCNVKKNHKYPLWSILFLALGVCNLCVSIIGAQSSWDRLVLPSLPLYLLMFGQLCTLFSVKSVKQLELK